MFQKKIRMLTTVFSFTSRNGKVFVEVDKDKDAQNKVRPKVDALIEARNLSIEQIVNMSRVLFQKEC